MSIVRPTIVAKISNNIFFQVTVEASHDAIKFKIYLGSFSEASRAMASRRKKTERRKFRNLNIREPRFRLQSGSIKKCAPFKKVGLTFRAANICKILGHFLCIVFETFKLFVSHHYHLLKAVLFMVKAVA